MIYGNLGELVTLDKNLWFIIYESESLVFNQSGLNITRWISAKIFQSFTNLKTNWKTEIFRTWNGHCKVVHWKFGPGSAFWVWAKHFSDANHKRWHTYKNLFYTCSLQINERSSPIWGKVLWRTIGLQGGVKRFEDYIRLPREWTLD